jgi:hypothetical protein
VEAPLTAGVDSKNIIFFSDAGDVMGEILPTLEASVNCVSLSLLEVEEVSDSSALIREDEPEETLEDALRCACTTEMSGAL